MFEYPKNKMANNSRRGRKKPQARSRRPAYKRREQRNHSLKTIKVDKNSIHSGWKKELGGIIRYYVHHRTKHGNCSKRQAEEEIQNTYSKCDCSTKQTKEEIIRAFGMTKGGDEEWIQMSMAIERNSMEENIEKKVSLELEQTVDKKGLQLKQIQKSGEGPAHSNESWNFVVVPDWSMGKSFFIQVQNRSAIDLSCEITIDDHKVARNVPLPHNETRTVRPDNTRYFESHKWVLQPAKRIKFGESKIIKTISNAKTAIPSGMTQRSNPPRRTKRYNGIRPTYTETNPRISIELYPDPTRYGWIFTGSVEESFVEFYEKKVNIGTVRMDLYYTSATVKTTLCHSTTGMNQLFRNKVSPEDFIKILQNPRSHTGRGYRRNDKRPVNLDVNTKEDDFDDDIVEAQSNEESMNIDSQMEVDEGTSSATTYYAKNDSYDFKSQGHSNRRVEMTKLNSSNEYNKWEEAAKKEWAVVHAKFYVSISQSMTRSGRRNHRQVSSQRNRNGRRQLENLPEQSSVVDIKAAENATLGTKFQATGKNLDRSTRRSKVKMRRIKGLDDSESMRGAPLFEYKLYYRSQDIFTKNTDMDSDNEMGDETNLNEYKDAMINKVEHLHPENMSARPEEAEEELKECKKKIRKSDNTNDIEEVVEIYFRRVTKSQFS